MAKMRSRITPRAQAGSGSQTPPKDHQRTSPRLRIVPAVGPLGSRDLPESRVLNDQRLRAVFEQAIVGVAQSGLNGRYVLVNDRYCEIVGRSKAEVLRSSVQDFTHPEDLKRTTPLFENLVRYGESYVIEKRYLRPDGRVIWVNSNVSLIRDGKGHPESVVAISEEITERKRMEAAARFLIRSTDALAASLDYQATLADVAQFAVPELADWVMIHLLDSHGRIRAVRTANLEPPREKLLREFSAYLPQLQTQKGNSIHDAIRSNSVQVRTHLKDEDYQKAAGSREQLRLFRALAPHSLIVAPLVSRGKTLGVITLARSSFQTGSGSSEYGSAEREMMQELAYSAATAIDNAELDQQARKAIHSRDEFLSVASHELKTPLTSLKLQFQFAIRQIERGDVSFLLPEQAKRRYRFAVRQMDRMGHLIEDMLDVSRITAGRMDLMRENSDLGEVVSRAVRRLSEEIRSRAAELKLAIKPNLVVFCDPQRIELAVTHLLTNALKYGMGSPIEVSVRATDSCAQIEVKDSGIGIAQEKFDRIFQRFERGISTEPISGLGLGLYITREIVEAHDGRVLVQSELGKGATFVIELPREVPELLRR